MKKLVAIVLSLFLCGAAFASEKNSEKKAFSPMKNALPNIAFSVLTEIHARNFPDDKIIV